MKRSYWIIGALVVLLVAGLWFWQRRGGGTTVLDLQARFETALRNGHDPDVELRSSMETAKAFSAVDRTIEKETHRAIFMHLTSRLTFKKVDVPDNASLRAWVAISQDAWDKPGDGVLFRFGVSDGRTYDELVRQYVDPANNPNDRRWIPLKIDLSAYAGQQVDLVFNTNSSLPGRGDDPRNDWALWGAPELFIER